MDMTPPTVTFSLDGKPLTAHAGETIWAAAQRHGVEIPHLCHSDPLRPVGNCRACMVEVAGERVLAASCCRAVTPDMQVKAQSPRALAAQRGVLELLAARKPHRVDRVNDELDHWAQRLGADRSRYATAFTGAQADAAHWPQAPAVDNSHPAITFHADACIQCTRCLRACREEQGNDVIGLAGRGAGARIVFDQGAPMGASTCVACGECVQACPTGALAPANGSWAKLSERTVDSVCPYCGVGCALTYHVQQNAQGQEHIARVEGRDGIANQSRLCVKGRFGFDYVANPARLTKPLIRRDDAPKDPEQVKLADWRTVFREASWDEALDRAAGGLLRIRGQHGGKALAGFGSAKGTNEEAYLFQKLVRAGFGTHNVDHCTRLCHASSVAALLEGLGSGAVSNPVMDVLQADVVMIIGANPTVNHPVGATWMKNALKRGTRLILADPRRTELSRKAWMTLQFKPGADLALLNAMLQVLFAENLLDRASVAARCHPEEVEAIRQHVATLSPEAMEPICGVSAADIRACTRAFATSKSSMIFWGMGISQHVHGTDNVRALIALCQLTGQIGRPGTGLHPLRGQNNVQGASDAGLIPMMFPDYVRTQDAGVLEQVERYWALPQGHLSRTPGLTVVEIVHAALAGTIRGMYIEGENPAMSDPDVHHARQALAGLDHLVVQDIFLTETAALADVVLPASAWPEKTGTVTNTDRLVQLGRKALASPGEARADLWIIQEMGRRLGVAPIAEVDMHGSEAGVGAVFEEMRGMMASIAGISWARLQREGSVTYPCPAEDEPGQRVVFIDRFPTADGRAKLRPAPLGFADEQPDNAYPYVLITGRELEHWHTGAMTRHASVLDALEPLPTVSIHPTLLTKLGLRAGQALQVESRRGVITLATRADEAMPEDAVFIPFAYAEAAANLLTNAALDPWGKIAEVKYCAVKLAPAVTAGAEMA
ncbi:MAG: molybdopterin-dependent oxidoreductase [Burkholderiales bacterium]|nr:molybdopterin-dependent oxidoreductase [Burkholderiales bacterium]